MPVINIKGMIERDTRIRRSVQGKHAWRMIRGDRLSVVRQGVEMLLEERWWVLPFGSKGPPRDDNDGESRSPLRSSYSSSESRRLSLSGDGEEDRNLRTVCRNTSICCCCYSGYWAVTTPVCFWVCRRMTLKRDLLALLLRMRGGVGSVRVHVREGAMNPLLTSVI